MIVQTGLGVQREGGGIEMRMCLVTARRNVLLGLRWAAMPISRSQLKGGFGTHAGPSLATLEGPQSAHLRPSPPAPRPTAPAASRALSARRSDAPYSPGNRGLWRKAKWGSPSGPSTASEMIAQPRRGHWQNHIAASLGWRM